MKIMEILVKDAVILNLGVRTKNEVLGEMAAALAKVEPQIDAAWEWAQGVAGSSGGSA